MDLFQLLAVRKYVGELGYRFFPNTRTTLLKNCYSVTLLLPFPLDLSVADIHAFVLVKNLERKWPT
jgi:hypothetical protein